MIFVLTIKDLIKDGASREELVEFCEKLYQMTDFVCEDYPMHNDWFHKKQLPQTFVEGSGRDIVFASDENEKVYGVAFIKEDETEKKICTLFVSEDARGSGIGTKLIEKCMEKLNTKKPMITIADYKLGMFEGLIKKYGWEKTQEVSGLYNDKYKELVYNGYLPEK